MTDTSKAAIAAVVDRLQDHLTLKWMSPPSKITGEECQMITVEALEQTLCLISALEAERDALKAEVAHWQEELRAANADALLIAADLEVERQRARLPEELVERIRTASIGTECPTWARYLLRDILAWHEQETRNE